MLKKKSSKLKLKIILISFLFFLIILLIFPKMYSENKTKEENIINQNIEEIEYDTIENETIENKIEENTIKEDEILEINLPDKMGKYNVIGELVIDKIGVKNNILDKTEDASLNLSVTKFYGPNVNEIGNFCITGHNYKNLLKRLSELEIGDTFYLISKEKKTKVTYKIYDMYTCYPNEVDCLKQPAESVREVTLITCNPGGVTRLICKAKEI